jgi:putative NIF3 family GTP cyclohydrolase 1 type 2
LRELSRNLCQHFGTSACRIAVPKDKTLENTLISSVAICAGSGGGLFENAELSEVDVLITGEMGHHQILAALKKGLSVCLYDHATTERKYLSEIFKPLLEKQLSERGLQHIHVVTSETDTEPLRLYIP